MRLIAVSIVNELTSVDRKLLTLDPPNPQILQSGYALKRGFQS
jgi:hypothetical protein